MKSVKDWKIEIKKAKDETKYWRDKCWIMANKNGLCYQHEAREADTNFNNLGVSFEYYIKNRYTCETCDQPKPLTYEEQLNLKKYKTEQ